MHFSIDPGNKAKTKLLKYSYYIFFFLKEHSYCIGCVATTHSPPWALHVQMAGAHAAMPLFSSEANNISKKENGDKGKAMICFQASDTCKCCDALPAAYNRVTRIGHVLQ